MNRKIAFCSDWKITISVSVLFGLLAVASAKVRVKRQDAISLGPSLGNYAHGCSAGEVKILDEQTVEITDMKYDGGGPTAWFFVTNSPEYASERPVDLRPLTLLLRDDDRSCVKPPAYNGVTVKLKMPQNDKIQNYKGLLLYCLRYNHNFCYVKIPEGTKPSPGTGGYTETCKPDYIGGGTTVQVQVSSLLVLSMSALLGIHQ